MRSHLLSVKRIEHRLDVVTYQVQHDVNKFRKQIVYLEATEEAMSLG